MSGQVAPIGAAAARRPPFARRAGAAAVLAAALAAALAPAVAVERPADRTGAVLAMAERARAACLDKGYAVTVSAVGTDGLPIVVLRGEGAPIHTVANSFDKAYTVMTLGPLKRLDSSSALAAAYREQPGVSYSIASEPLPHVIFAAGAVLLRMDGRVVGGLGVSGSDGGDIDEACARAGVGDAR